MVSVRRVTMPGSSPRVRGAASTPARPSWPSGIIPARAGSSRSGAPLSDARRDHPRACGEQYKAATGKDISIGSSPRVRGAAVRDLLDARDARIIPARAGSRPPGGWHRRGWSDHPRACGEQAAALHRHGVHLGSSPRVRGADSRCGSRRNLQRIIPARAGSRRAWRSGVLPRRDHPRACGEQSMSSWRRLHLSGSSPRVRGAAAPARRRTRRRRIIPARAGSSASTAHSRGWTGDHPRACGEQVLTMRPPRLRTGSSPRVRGAVPCRQDREPRPGIIPARAGSSANERSLGATA